MKKILIIVLFFITGCTKYTDLGDLAIIKSIGIDYDDSYILYAEIYDEIKKDNDPKTVVVKTKGKTINEVFDNLKQEIDKEIFLSHIDLLILSDKLNNKNYQDIINYSIDNNLRNDFYCILSSNIEILLKESKYDEVENYLKTNKETKDIINISFNEVINYFLSNKPFYLSMINYDNKIKHLGNYQYFNNNIERINNEENRNKYSDDNTN